MARWLHLLHSPAPILASRLEQPVAATGTPANGPSVAGSLTADIPIAVMDSLTRCESPIRRWIPASCWRLFQSRQSGPFFFLDFYRGNGDVEITSISTEQGVHAGRAAGRDRHHRAVDRDSAAGVEQGKAAVAGDGLRQQSAPDGHRDVDVSERTEVLPR